MTVRIALIVPIVHAQTKQPQGWVGWERDGKRMLPTSTISETEGLESAVIQLGNQCGLISHSGSWRQVSDYVEHGQRTVWFTKIPDVPGGACLPDPHCMPVHIADVTELYPSWQQRDLVDILHQAKCPDTQRDLFVTTALPYANAPFHMGHIMEYTQADIWVRFQRMQGHLVHFVCADDAHGAPIMLAAQKAGMTPQAFVSSVSKARAEYLEAFHIQFDHWHSTDGDDNHTMSKDMYLALRDAGLIVRKDVEQFYDVQQQMFLPDRFIKGECPKCGAQDQYGDSCEVCSSVYSPVELINPYSVLSHTTPIRKSSEHHFFKLSDPRCVSFLSDYVRQKDILQPEVLNKIQEWFALDDDGVSKLKDWDISRDAPYFGIEIPDAPGKYFYVWLDAPVGYLSTLKHYFDAGKAKTHGDHRTFSEFMQSPKMEQIHFIGKDITYFHTLFWPAMLHFSGHKTPDHIYVHGFMTVNGKKMSKSRGTGIDPMTYHALGLEGDHLRYYLASKLTAKVEDVDFSPVDFTTKVNVDLIGKYVNIASRSAGFIHKRFGGELFYLLDEPGKTLIDTIRARSTAISQAYNRRDFSVAIKETFQVVDLVNSYVDQYKPWELAKNPEQNRLLHQVCSTCLEAFRMLSIYLKPVIPSIVSKAEHFLRVEPLSWKDLDMALGKHTIGSYVHLTQRVQLEDVLGLFPKVQSDDVTIPVSTLSQTS